MTTDRDNSELLLAAFRYLSGELSAEEAADFEALLSSEQPARDALADAVELSESVAIEEFERCRPLRMEDPVDVRRRFTKWGTIVAVCVVACGALIVLNTMRQPDVAEPVDVAAQPEEELTAPATANAHSVISLWSELGWDNAEPFEADVFPAEGEEADTSPTAGEIPEWMLTAVGGDADQPPPDMPDEMRELMDELDRENL